MRSCPVGISLSSEKSVNNLIKLFINILELANSSFMMHKLSAFSLVLPEKIAFFLELLVQRALFADF